ncbi:MAG TPA: carboxymuconolactone decarboxylase family protein [Acidimicrobiales bacterium]
MTPAPSPKPRIAPAEGDPEGLLPLNIFRTMSKHRGLADRFNRFGGYLLLKGLIPARERELVILRVGWRCGSVYEFGQHTLMSQPAGVTEDEIARAATESLEGWATGDRDLMAFVDELCATNTVSDQAWERVAGRWSEEQMIELLLLAGFYRLVSGFLNSVRVELDPGVPGWPEGREPGSAG